MAPTPRSPATGPGGPERPAARDAQRTCPWCGHPTTHDYVHGHVQCRVCKKNIDPCCEGEQACPPEPA
ncbi:MAG: hypothetical protein ACKOCB_02090 [Planctomycetia bacterium]